MRLEKRSWLAMVAVGSFVFASGHTEPSRRPWVEPPMLMVTVVGDSVDFILTDPHGHVGALAVDSAFCEIPDCQMEKYSDDVGDDPDESEPVDTSAVEPRLPYGGGLYALSDPAPGTWHLEAHVARPCADQSCVARVNVQSWLTPEVVDGVETVLETGKALRWRLVIGPRSKRSGKAWAKLYPESGSTRSRTK